jgi:hypothetical protein
VKVSRLIPQAALKAAAEDESIPPESRQAARFRPEKRLLIESIRAARTASDASSMERKLFSALRGGFQYPATEASPEFKTRIEAGGSFFMPLRIFIGEGT